MGLQVYDVVRVEYMTCATVTANGQLVSGSMADAGWPATRAQKTTTFSHVE